MSKKFIVNNENNNNAGKKFIVSSSENKNTFHINESDLSNNANLSLSKIIMEVGPNDKGNGLSSRVYTVEISDNHKRITDSTTLWSKLRINKAKTKYFLVSNTNDKRNISECEGLMFRIHDFERYLDADINLRFKAKCKPEDEQKMLLALCDNVCPEEELYNYLESWIKEFTNEKESNFIDNFDDEKSKLERFLCMKAHEKIGLTMRTIISLQQNEISSIKIQDFEIPIKLSDYDRKVLLIINLETEIIEKLKLKALTSTLDKYELTQTITAQIQNYAMDSITSVQFYYDLNSNIINTIKELINNALLKGGQKIKFFSIDKKISPPMEKNYEKTIEHVAKSQLGNNNSGQIELSIKLVLKFQYQNIHKYLQSEIPQIDIWCIDKINTTFDRLIFEVGYSAFKKLDDIKMRTQQLLSEELFKIGFQVDIISMKFIFPELESIKRFEDMIEIQIKLIGYSKPITVVNKIKMTISDYALYLEQNSPSLSNWIRDNLNEAFNDQLFSVNYLDFILEFDKKSIESIMKNKSKTIGYNLEHLIIQPQFEPLKWCDIFQVELTDKYLTKIGRHVPMKIVVFLRISDLKKVEKYINTTVDLDIKEEIKKHVRNIAESVMIQTDPYHFYMKFENVDPLTGDKSLVEILKQKITEKLQDEFSASIVSITPQMVKNEDDTIKKLDALLAESRKIEFSVASLDGGEAYSFSGQYRVNGVCDDRLAWETFIIATITMDIITERIQTYLVSKMQLLKPEQLKFYHKKHEYKEKFEQYVVQNAKECTRKYFGLDISLLEIQRSRTQLEDEKFKTQQNIDLLNIKMDNAEIEEVENDLERGLYKSKKLIDFDKKQLDEELKRLEDIEREITTNISGEYEEDNTKLLQEKEKITKNIERIKDEKKLKLLNRSSLKSDNDSLDEKFRLFDDLQIGTTKQLEHDEQINSYDIDENKND